MTVINNEINGINFPFIGLFWGLGVMNKGIKFDTDNLFWSLTRLFNLYGRIVSEYFLFKERKIFNRANLECDLENFYLRYKIVVDNIFYIISQVYLENKIRGIPDYSKNGYIKGLSEFYKKYEKNEELKELHPEFVNFLKESKKFIFDKKYFRDALSHNKAKVCIYEKDVLEYSFDTLKGNHFGIKKNIDGSISHNSVDILLDINWDMFSLYELINKDLFSIYKDFFIKKGIYSKIGEGTILNSSGVHQFKTINNL